MEKAIKAGKKEGRALMKSWSMFVAAIGFLLICVSPQLPMTGGYLLMGVILVAAGLWHMKKKGRGGKK